MIRPDRDFAASLPADTALPVSISRPSDSDRRYVLGSWSEAWKLVPPNADQSWFFYKRERVPLLRAVLERPDTELLGAYSGGNIVGWLALCRMRRVDIVHWVHTRFRVGHDGDKLRKRRVMAQLFDAAELKPHLAYTFRGPRPRHPHPGESRERSDEMVSSWLVDRGHHVAYIPYQEWSK